MQSKKGTPGLVNDDERIDLSALKALFRDFDRVGELKLFDRPKPLVP